MGVEGRQGERETGRQGEREWDWEALDTMGVCVPVCLFVIKRAREKAKGESVRERES
jgi:hypothetical protein